MIRIIIFLFILHLYVHRSDSVCLNNDHTCGENDIFKCIPKEWLCDGSLDCSDGSDEINCPVFTCDENHIKCKYFDLCIPKKEVCNGEYNCPDNSDEMNCTCQKTEYDCQNKAKLECIQLENVCNKEVNCSNNRDSKENCNIDLCKNNKGQCSHICINRYSSFMCDCPKGMVLSNDNKTCKDYDKCLEEPEICSQECRKLGSEYRCSCLKGYIAKNNNCVLENPESAVHLLFSSQKKIYSVPVFENYHSNARLIDIAESRYNILSFDIKLQKDFVGIYSSLLEKENLLSISMIPSLKSKSIKKSSSDLTIEGQSFMSTALDPVRNLLFYTDLNNRSISVMNITSIDDRLKIIEDDCYFPISIVVDPIFSRLFWIDLGGNNVGPRIQMSGMDGSSRKTIITKDLYKPRSLALDIDDQRLYWANTYPPSIQFLSLKSINNLEIKPTIVLNNPYIQPKSIVIFANKIYWSDWEQKSIYSAHKTSGKGIKMILKSNDAKTLRIMSMDLNNKIIQRVHTDGTTSSCSDSVNICPLSCLPRSDVPSLAKCFGQKKSVRQAHLWIIIIPIVFVLLLIPLVAKFIQHSKRKIKSPERSTENAYNYDHVRFWDDQRQNEIEVSDSLPIINHEIV